MTTTMKNKYYTHNTYDDGTEVFTIDTLLLDENKVDVSINTDDSSIYIYTPESRNDLQVQLPDSFSQDDYTSEFNNGILTVEWTPESE